jgi:hypothetical protein
MQPARHTHQPHPIAQVVLQGALDAEAQIGLRRLACSATGSGANQSLTGHLDEIFPLHQWEQAPGGSEGDGDRFAEAFRYGQGQVLSTGALRALRVVRLRAAAGCLRREGESVEAIGKTAENPTPTGRPQRSGKGAPWGRMA